MRLTALSRATSLLRGTDAEAASKPPSTTFNHRSRAHSSGRETRQEVACLVNGEVGQETASGTSRSSNSWPSVKRSVPRMRHVEREIPWLPKPALARILRLTT
jgi:hypothetical protein